MTVAAVTVAYLHGNEVPYSWHRSLLDLIGYDLTRDQRVVRGGWMSMKAATGGIVEGRNDAVAGFLAEKDSEWLWWVDSDMGFAPDTVDRLLAAADPVGRPVVGGLCFAYKEAGPDGLGGSRCAPRPTIFDWVSDGAEQGFKGRNTYPVNAVVRCAGTGSACLLVHRSVFERIEAQFGPVWYDRWPNPSGKGWVSEDLSFCMRVGAIGAPLYVHTGVRTSHAKMTWVAEEDYWASAIAPPAAQECAVIVPVLRRPQNAEPFMRSLRASTGLATAYAVCDPSDEETMRAWHAAGAQVTLLDAPHDDGGASRPGTFAEKVNHGYRNLDGVGLGGESWLLLVGDDVRFHPGWLDHAQAIAGDRYDVVGTNDLVNPRVTSGEHATHLLVRRSYVDEQGASWDGPKVVAHEGYRHWYVDDEIVTAAKQRDVWAMALGARVEHLHPMFTGGPTDDVYELGQANAEADRLLFEERVQRYL